MRNVEKGLCERQNKCSLVTSDKVGAHTRDTKTERQVRNQKVREQKESGELLHHALLFVSNSCLLLFEIFLLVKITRKPFFFLYFYFT